MMLLAALSLAVWTYLLLGHGRFWQRGPVLAAARPDAAPAVTVIVPARNEAAGVETALRSLLMQDYPGPLRVVLVDDGSTDGTAAMARQIADARLAVIEGAARPDGWSGKLWALSQGVAQADGEWLLLTDADITHDQAHLSTLVAQAQRGRCDLVSEMVELRCASFAERALVPAFVYFFAMLYPFALVNDAESRVAAAAGGTMLVRRAALGAAGGLEAMRGALIDDVALAARLKPHGRIWLGHSALAASRRAYPRAADVWRMVARTAFVQLRRSLWLLLLTVAALAVVFVMPPLALFAGQHGARWSGGLATALMAASFVPTLRRFRLSPARALTLPLIAVFYGAATIGSAIDHYRGRGVVWRGRVYPV